MTTKRHTIQVRDLEVEVVRKAIKNLHLGVYPPGGRVRVAAPLRVDDEAVRLAVVGKLGWIRRQQARFAEQSRQSEREMVSGECHYYQGTRYRLDVVETSGRQRVERKGHGTLRLHARPGADAAKRAEILNQWYREQLKAELPRLIARWEPVMGVSVAEWGIKRMKTRWGTCNTRARRIWINLELAKKPPECLEYIVVHEMVHLLERTHNERFRDYMDTFLPAWRQHRDLLNRSPLAHEAWSY